jgi:hypothetical protein
VDLRHSARASGAFGTLDQIFPHELAHIMIRRLAGDSPPGGGSQVHAIAVRTDPQTAFNEGFAEHVQVRAIDDPDAVPDTRALPADAARLAWAHARLASYRHALESRWALAPPGRIAFPLWFSSSEQILRYHAVKADSFSRLAAIPPRLQERPNPWDAYLLENILPGERDGPRRAAANRLSAEGAVSAFVLNWVTNPEIQRARMSPEIYAAFGVSDGIEDIENAYLKIFHVLAIMHAYDLGALVRGYLATYPSEREVMIRLLARADWPELARAPANELWLQSLTFKVGTSLFDQFRSLPRAHTFDLNAATATDLWTVPGMTTTAARILLSNAPYESIPRDMVPPTIAASLEQMAIAAQRSRADELEARVAMDVRAILASYPIHAGIWLVMASLSAALLGRAATEDTWPRLIGRALVSTLTGMLPAWIFDQPMLALAAPVVASTPLSFWSWRKHGGRRAWRMGLGWLCASLPGYLIVQPLF